jgi:hypothetical protein
MDGKDYIVCQKIIFIISKLQIFRLIKIYYLQKTFSTSQYMI